MIEPYAYIALIAYIFFLLERFTNSLDLEQAEQNVGPD